VAGFYEYDYETSGPMKAKNFFLNKR